MARCYAGFGGVATSLPLVKAGRLRVLAVTSARRSAYFPDAPTLDEVGLKGYELVTPMWAFARHGTPQAIVSQLSTAMTKAAGTQAFKEFCATQGLEPAIQPEAGARAARACVPVSAGSPRTGCRTTGRRLFRRCPSWD